MKKFNVFNTNNLWMKLETVQQNVQEGTLDMEIIVNPKSLGKLSLDSCFMSMLANSPLGTFWST